MQVRIHYILLLLVAFTSLISPAYTETLPSVTPILITFPLVWAARALTVASLVFSRGALSSSVSGIVLAIASIAITGSKLAITGGIANTSSVLAARTQAKDREAGTTSPNVAL